MKVRVAVLDVCVVAVLVDEASQVGDSTLCERLTVGELDAKSVSDGDNDVVKEAVGVVESLDMRLVLESDVSSDDEFDSDRPAESDTVSEHETVCDCDTVDVVEPVINSVIVNVAVPSCDSE